MSKILIVGQVNPEFRILIIVAVARNPLDPRIMKIVKMH
jgi:hypothetical protein